MAEQTNDFDNTKAIQKPEIGYATGNLKSKIQNLKSKMILFPILLLPGAIAELVASTATTGYITLADRYGLMAAVLDETLPEEERLSVDRLLRAICRGRLKIVNELSAVT
ncbi:MAG TPA: hypothetical protein V6D13_01730 [Halomicronema sp.]